MTHADLTLSPPMSIHRLTMTKLIHGHHRKKLVIVPTVVGLASRIHLTDLGERITHRSHVPGCNGDNSGVTASALVHC